MLFYTLSTILFFLLVPFSISNIFSQKACDPIFSHQRGFYNEPFELIINSALMGAAIRYTIDGTDPATSKTASTGNIPVKINIDPAIVENRNNTPGFLVRAYTFKDDFEPSDVITQTYIFPEKVKTQTYPGEDWPAPNSALIGQSIIYDVSTKITQEDVRYKDSITDALLDIPSISLVANLENFFDPAEGIYSNPHGRGKFWEQPVSVEFINMKNNRDFHINAGMRIRGGWSRRPDNPKHALRLYFRKEYGKGKLDYPLFGEEGTTSFDKIDLRTSQNYSWSGEYSDMNIMNREVLFRDLQGKTKNPYTRSRYYHLYINGMYWGIYQTEERPSGTYGESYFGGKKDDYDVVKPIGSFLDGHGGQNEITEGNWDAFNRLVESSTGFANNNELYFKVQGLNENGTINPDYEKLVDLEHLIDYNLIVFYADNWDGPGRGGNVNNYFGMYNRENPDGFKYFVHDFEHALVLNGDNWSFQNEEIKVFPEILSPYVLLNNMMQNDECKVKFYDRVYKWFYKEKVFQPDSVIKLFMDRANQIDKAIIAESARWGDVYSTNNPRNKYDDWLPFINRIKNEFLPTRTETVMSSIISTGFYPSTKAPDFISNSTTFFKSQWYINSTQNLLISKNGQTGQLAITFDGTDPRETGGQINSTALTPSSDTNISISSSLIIKSRILNDNEWSPLNEMEVYYPENFDGLKITEIHYNPLNKDTINGSDYEFIEIYNSGTSPINLTGCQFIAGIKYTFIKQALLQPGQYLVLASNLNRFKERYAFNAFDQFKGNLDNKGERIILIHPFNDTIINIEYNNKLPWPLAADGKGFSLVLKDSILNEKYNSGDSWNA